MYIYIYMYTCIYIYIYIQTSNINTNNNTSNDYMVFTQVLVQAPLPDKSNRSVRRKQLPGAQLSKAPKGNGIGATGSKNWVWF